MSCLTGLNAGTQRGLIGRNQTFQRRERRGRRGLDGVSPERAVSLSPGQRPGFAV